MSSCARPRHIKLRVLLSIVAVGIIHLRFDLPAPHIHSHAHATRLHTHGHEQKGRISRAFASIPFRLAMSSSVSAGQGPELEPVLTQRAEIHTPAFSERGERYMIARMGNLGSLQTLQGRTLIPI